MAEFVKTRMTAKEYAALPETNQPMELIDGEVITLPTPYIIHQMVSARLFGFLFAFIFANKLGELISAPSDVYIDEQHVFQPDIFFVATTNTQCLIKDRYYHGAPDLCIEILSSGTEKRDRIVKSEVYARNGVREYWIVEPEVRYLEIYVLDGTTYRKQGGYEETQSVTSSVLPGLTINLADIFPAKTE